MFQFINSWFKVFNTLLYISFIDLEKAFNSIHRESLWKILRYYGVPTKLIQVFAMLYNDPKSQMICNTELTHTFNVSTGVKQGCLLSLFLFILAMDWIMKNSTCRERKGIRWTTTMTTKTLEDIDFADEFILLSHRHQDMQEKTVIKATIAENLGLKVRTKKTKSMQMIAKDSIKLNGNEIEEVNDFTYLGSKMSNTGDGEVEIRARVAKASQALASLKGTWKAGNIRLKTKIRIFKSNVNSTLLYGSESWKMTKTINSKLDVFQNSCLRHILHMYWPNVNTIEEPQRKTKTEPIPMQVKQRRW
jgi:hypothetical protein